jgi:hypothetical protein
VSDFDFDVRRLAAVDMHGASGRPWRARIILAEFALGAVVLPVLGLGALLGVSGLGWKLFGAWLVGVGLNYVPLTVHAVRFSRRRALADELAGVDVPRELRRYTTAQAWVFVPLALVWFALRP